MSERAHKVVGEGEMGELPKIEEAIDQQATKVWGLTERESKEILASLKEAEE